jgi:hypothetical protein
LERGKLRKTGRNEKERKLANIGKEGKFKKNNNK